MSKYTKDIEFMFIAFDSTHKAIHFEKLLQNQYAIELIPTPREVTASCGLSLKFYPDDLASLLITIDDEDLDNIRLYHYTKTSLESKAVQRPWR